MYCIFCIMKWFDLNKVTFEEYCKICNYIRIIREPEGVDKKTFENLYKNIRKRHNIYEFRKRVNGKLVILFKSKNFLEVIQFRTKFNNENKDSRKPYNDGRKRKSKKENKS